MCISDVTPIGLYHITNGATWPDFATEHKCRNFDEILKWGGEVQSTVENLNNTALSIQPRPGDIVLDQLP